GKFHRGKEWVRAELPWRVTIRAPARDRTARRPICHRLSSGEFPRALPLLRVASGTHGRARRLLRKVSSRRPRRAAGFPGGERLLRGGRGSAQNLASSVVQVSWEQVNSRDRPVSF